MSKKIAQILRKTPFLDYFGSIDTLITSVEYDSRKCVDGSCFVAIRGNNFDGNNFIENAISNGAKLIVTDNEVIENNLNPDITYLQVENSRKTLAEISHSFYDSPSSKIKVIGITGTNGKTTTTFVIKSILETAGKSVAIIGTTGIYINGEKLETNLTTPESSDLAKIFHDIAEQKIEFAVMEVSSVALVQHRVDCIDFDIACFTNLTQDHLDFHQTMDEYAISKKMLFDMVSDQAAIIVNSEDSYADYMIQSARSTKISKIGRSSSSYFKILNENKSKTGNQFLLHFNGHLIDARTKLIGHFNIDNCAMAAAVCYLSGIDTTTIEKGLYEATGAPGRMHSISLKNRAIGIVDYAHTPDALEKALKSCKLLLNGNSQHNKIISVFGCGGDRDKTKRPLMGSISEQFADFTVITNDNPRTEQPIDIINDIISGIKLKDKIIIEPDREAAIKKAIEISNLGDIILVAGKGHENYQIIGKEKHHFDDWEQLIKYS